MLDIEIVAGPGFACFRVRVSRVAFLFMLALSGFSRLQ